MATLTPTPGSVGARCAQPAALQRAAALLARGEGAALVLAFTAVVVIDQQVDAGVAAAREPGVAGEVTSARFAQWRRVGRCGACVIAAAAVFGVALGLDAATSAIRRARRARGDALAARADLIRAAGLAAAAAVVRVTLRVDAQVAAANEPSVARDHAFTRLAARFAKRR